MFNNHVVMIRFTLMIKLIILCHKKVVNFIHNYISYFFMYVVYLSINVSLTSVISKQQDEYANTPDEPSQKNEESKGNPF